MTLVFQLKAVAYGLGALLALGGIVLIALGNQAKQINDSEINSGWLLIAIAVVMWIAGFISKESKRGGIFHK